MTHRTLSALFLVGISALTAAQTPRERLAKLAADYGIEIQVVDAPAKFQRSDYYVTAEAVPDDMLAKYEPIFEAEWRKYSRTLMVMTRLGRPRGLIRYDSQNAFQGRATHWLRGRTILYFVLLVVGAAVAGWALSTVKPASFGVTRMTGAPYIVDESSVRNQFLVRIVNKRNIPTRFEVKVSHTPAATRHVGFEAAVEVPPLGEFVQPLVLQQARAAYTAPFKFEVRVADVEGKFHLEREVEFMGPEARLLREEEAEHHGKP